MPYRNEPDKTHAEIQASRSPRFSNLPAIDDPRCSRYSDQPQL